MPTKKEDAAPAAAETDEAKPKNGNGSPTVHVRVITQTTLTRDSDGTLVQGETDITQAEYDRWSALNLVVQVEPPV